MRRDSPYHYRARCLAVARFTVEEQDMGAALRRLGFAETFEFGPVRRWLIPNIKAELGGWVDARTDHVFQLSPMLGLHLWADRHIWVDIDGGYRVVPAENRKLSGPRAMLSVLVNAW